MKSREAGTIIADASQPPNSILAFIYIFYLKRYFNAGAFSRRMIYLNGGLISSFLALLGLIPAIFNCSGFEIGKNKIVSSDNKANCLKNKWIGSSSVKLD